MAHLSSAETIALFQKYVIPNYTRYPVCLVRGEGSLVWDAEGNRYIDFFPGWGCNLLGHAPPGVVRAVQEQAAELIHVPNTWYMEAQGLLAKALSERSFSGQCFFCNSGAEANEAALKLARLHGKGTRYKIITMEGGFHGRTMGAVSATAQPKYHQGFQPMLPGFTYVPFGDLEAATRAADAETCAILVEPIQGEGGIRIPPDDYLRGLRQLADREGLLLMFDEVQAGMGRTGKWFGYQNFPGVEPDVMTLAKSLGGGVAAGAVVARPEVAALLKPGLHASTFGGNPLACRAALAFIETVEAEQLLNRAAALGEKFKARFDAVRRQCHGIKEVRVKGVMVGIELAGDGIGVVQRCLEERLLVNCTQGCVIRLLPPMNLPDDLFDEGCSILERALQAVAGAK